VKLDPSKLYLMPLIAGPQYDKDPLPQLAYPQVENLAIRFQTEHDAARALVPECYQLDSTPQVTVVFGYFHGLGFLAGGGYNVAMFQIAARFDGERDHLEGDYIPVMFENHTQPILGGREFLGVHKWFVDIPPAKLMPGGSLRCEASLWGHFLFALDLPPLKRQNPIVKAVASRQINSRPWLGYKYVPALDGPPDADYATTTRNDVKVDRFWMGSEGSLTFGSPSEAEVGPTVHIVEALRSLPVIQVEQALRFQGSAVLRFDQSHRLI